ncbi:hypothetical protein CIW83_09565 [Tissierella sp. P1]|uniref:hypothetical protein n=1 Tax=Tissierella sp. P1 TaxID=1280483 RepID=UPI000BA05EC6|nr:hypothetical protein [Tissierella sp. P1]OZV12334.1 hypothetical protein CIW83_09565 [Tissierella sp. P1]
MTSYNSGKVYNKKLPDGGANYNSGPFAIIILDSGYGLDSIKDIFANIPISDNAIADESIALIASVEVLDKSISSDDNISIILDVNISDSAVANDSLSLTANLNISDAGFITDSDVSVAGAFFVIDSNNILHPLGVLVTGDSDMNSFLLLEITQTKYLVGMVNLTLVLNLSLR